MFLFLLLVNLLEVRAHVLLLLRLLLVRLLVLLAPLLLVIRLLCSVDLSRPARPARKRGAAVPRRKAASIRYGAPLGDAEPF